VLVRVPQPVETMGQSAFPHLSRAAPAAKRHASEFGRGVCALERVTGCTSARGAEVADDGSFFERGAPCSDLPGVLSRGLVYSTQ